MLNAADNPDRQRLILAGIGLFVLRKFQVAPSVRTARLPCPTLQPHSYTTCGLCRRDLPARSRGGAVKRRASSRAARWRWRNAALLRRPRDWAIGRAVR